MNLILLGAPGSGKGTQAEKLGVKYGLPHISTGDIFRKKVEDKSQLASQLKRIMEKGELVPDKLVIEITGERLEQEDCSGGFILDGFPRTLPQAQELENILAERTIDRVIYIELSEDEIVKRLTGRRLCTVCKAGFHVVFKPPKKQNICDKCGGKLYQRDDDSEETIRQRMKVFYRQTMPLIEYYSRKKVIKKINGDKTVDEVFLELCRVIEG